MRKGLTLTPGTALRSADAPRATTTRSVRASASPGRRSRTARRRCARAPACSTDWLDSRHLRADAARRRLPPAGAEHRRSRRIPDPGNVGVVPPINKYLLADDLQMARNVRVSAGVDYALNPFSRLGVTYAHISGTGLLRGINLNAPVDGIRPDPDARQPGRGARRRARRGRTRSTRSSQISLTPPSMGPPKERWNWKRTNFGLNYTLGQIGERHRRRRSRCRRPAASRRSGDRRRTTSATASARSSAPTGSAVQRQPEPELRQRLAVHDPHRLRRQRRSDLQRPSGRRRPQLGARRRRVHAQRILRLQHSDRPEEARADAAGHLRHRQRRATSTCRRCQADALPRFRMGIVVNAQNLTNRANYVGYSGTLSSPLFGQPTAVQGMRRIDVGLNFNF